MRCGRRWILRPSRCRVLHRACNSAREDWWCLCCHWSQTEGVLWWFLHLSNCRKGEYFLSLCQLQFQIQFDFVYDRASIVAILPAQRDAYVDRVKSLLTANASILMICLIREEGRQGPPHSVDQEHVEKLYANAKLLESNDDLSSIDRLGKIVENVYMVTQ